MSEKGFKELLEFFQRFLETERLNHISSPIHRLDPRVKIAASFLLVTSALAVDGVAYVFLLACAVLSLLLASRIPKAVFISRTLPFTLFSVAVVSPVTFITPGVPAALIQLPFATLTPTFEGVYRAVTFVFRVWVCVSSALLLVFTTRFPDIAAGFRMLGVPALFSTMLLLTYRYASLFADEALMMLQAKELRTFSREGFLERVKGVGRIAGCLFLRAYERGEEVYYAMSLRGFNGREKPPGARLKLRDAVFLAAFSAFCVTVAFLGFGGASILAFWLPFFRVVLVEAPLRWIVLAMPLTGGFIVA